MKCGNSSLCPTRDTKYEIFFLLQERLGESCRNRDFCDESYRSIRSRGQTGAMTYNWEIVVRLRPTIFVSLLALVILSQPTQIVELYLIDIEATLARLTGS